MLYPEDPGNLARVKNRPEHMFFKSFGESMTKGAWNHPGTKQGIYMIGPNAEYLEGRFAASSDAGDIRARLSRALERWETLKTEKNYANLPVPAVKFSPPPGVGGKLILRVNLRDLPRGSGDRSGARFAGEAANWADFVKWAWNENWIGLPEPTALVPKGNNVEKVSDNVVEQIAREVLVDNVRGQAPQWSPEHVKEATLTMKRTGSKIEYQGKVRLEAGPRGYDAVIYGQGTWSGREFTGLDLVVTGMRRGAWQFNQRERDLGPAPMGVTLSLHR